MHGKTVEIENVRVEYVTPRAVLCVIEGKEYWIPISQIDEAESEITGESPRGLEGTLVISEWIAGEKGLV